MSQDQDKVYPSLNNEIIVFDLCSKETFHVGHTKGTINFHMINY